MEVRKVDEVVVHPLSSVGVAQLGIGELNSLVFHLLRAVVAVSRLLRDAVSGEDYAFVVDAGQLELGLCLEKDLGEDPSVVSIFVDSPNVGPGLHCDSRGGVRELLMRAVYPLDPEGGVAHETGRKGSEAGGGGGCAVERLIFQGAGRVAVAAG